ncbi:MAG: hypothetical protein HQK79_20355, partial [Desulfobacterales bacterium]|nr:hypothetical protein [Desulfobacterales bacterium]
MKAKLIDVGPGFMNPRSGKVEFEDGRSNDATDLYFYTNQVHTKYINDKKLFIAFEEFSLPILQGYGGVRALPFAINENPLLKEFVTKLNEEKNILNLYFQIDELLAKWTHSDEIHPEAVRGDFNARKLAILEKFMGEKFRILVNDQISWDVFGNADRNILNKAYDQLHDLMFKNFVFQTIFASKLDDTYYSYILDKIIFPYEGEALASYLSTFINSCNIQEKILFGKVFNMIEKDSGISIEVLRNKLDESTFKIINMGINNTWSSDDTDDFFSGTAYNDLVAGFEGNDNLHGNDGDDFIDGGGGNDSLHGSTGNDVLFGGKGDDILYGENDNDILEGGLGDDYLNGGEGDNIYLYAKGDGSDTIERGIWWSTSSGKDTIKFNEGLNIDSFEYIAQSGNWGSDIILRLKETGETLTIKNWFANNRYQVDRFQFADGTELTASQISEKVVMSGTDRDDTLSAHEGYITPIYGFDGNDRLNGNSGNDIIDGGAGDDIIYSNKGDDKVTAGNGNDTIYGNDGNDILTAGEGNDSLYGEDGNDVLNGGSGDDYLN